MSTLFNIVSSVLFLANRNVGETDWVVDRNRRNSRRSYSKRHLLPICLLGICVKHKMMHVGTFSYYKYYKTGTLCCGSRPSCLQNFFFIGTERVVWAFQPYWQNKLGILNNRDTPASFSSSQFVRKLSLVSQNLARRLSLPSASPRMECSCRIVIGSTFQA